MNDTRAVGCSPVIGGVRDGCDTLWRNLGRWLAPVVWCVCLCLLPAQTDASVMPAREVMMPEGVVLKEEATAAVGSVLKKEAITTAASVLKEEATAAVGSVLKKEAITTAASVLKEEATPTAASVLQGETIIPCRFVDPRGFPWMLSRQDTSTAPVWRTAFPLGGVFPDAIGERVPRGLVLPHHDVASPMTARILSEAAAAWAQWPVEEKPEVIVLMGPNHNRVGDARIQTFFADWDTPEGVMRADQAGCRLLADAFGADGDPALMECEHSLTYLVPWVHHFFPETTLLPVTLHGNLDRRSVGRLTQTLADHARTRRILFIASVDFSHGLAPEAALRADETTWRLVESGDTDGVMRLDNRYLDAPPTLALMMSTMSALGMSPQLTGHAEASLFMDVPVADTTSYLCVTYQN